MKVLQGIYFPSVFFSLGMTDSPLPIWIMRESFLSQITEQGMPEDYITALEAASSPSMLIVLFAAPVIGAVIGGLIAKKIFQKHFEKAGSCKMKQTRTGRASIDPRTGLVLLVMANLIALGQKSIWVEAGWISAADTVICCVRMLADSREMAVRLFPSADASILRAACFS